MAKLTINELLQLITQVSKRASDLRSIRSQSVSREKTTYGIGESTRTTETIVQYDVKVVDKKITELENFLFRAGAAIKQANATTIVGIDVNADDLLAPLE